MKILLPLILACFLTALPFPGGLFGGDAAVDAGLVVCPECTGEGISACPLRCREGKVRCPATCLKKDDPGWGPGPDGKTIKNFPSKKPGVLGGVWWSNGHIGQLIVYEDGLPVNKGVCPTCKGTSLADCKRCGGSGKLTCLLCKGAKKVSKTGADAYLAKVAAEKKANSITLSDGRILQGKIVGRTPGKIIIKTNDGKMETVDLKDVVEAPEVEGKEAK